MVNVLDLVAFLVCFGDPPTGTCATADINQDGAVNVLDLVQLLLHFGEACPCAITSVELKSLEEEMAEAGLTMDDWDEFMDVMLNGTEEEKDNYECWMIHYLSECPTIFCPPNCPGPDPFGGH